MGVTYLSRPKIGLARRHRLMSSSDTCIGIRVYIYICGVVEYFIFRLKYVLFYLCIDLWKYRFKRILRC